MKTQASFFVVLFLAAHLSQAQSPAAREANISSPGILAVDTFGDKDDSIPSYILRDVTIVSFKSAEEWMTYYKYKSRIQKVLPYVKVANQLYDEMKSKKELERKRDYKNYRKDLEKEMRTRFEKELKDLTTSQGEMLFKLINRETSNNAYNIIKDIKGPFTAWFYQVVGKRWGYNLKDTYDPEKERMIELIIREMGASYDVK